MMIIAIFSSCQYFKIINYFFCTCPSMMKISLVKFNVVNFDEQEGLIIKSTGNEISLETGVYFISNVSSAPRL